MARPPTALAVPEPAARGCESAGNDADDPDSELVRWVGRSGIAPGRLFAGGLGLAAAATLGAWLIPGLGMLGTLVFGSAFTIGGGLAFLGVRMWQRRTGPDAAPRAALTPSRRSLLEERARRVDTVLSEVSVTFDGLMQRLRWTEVALVETLTYMRDTGRLVEDLDLETGAWVYRLADPEAGGRAGLTLADRRARLGLETGPDTGLETTR